MNNPVRMQVLESIDNLHSITLYLELMKSLPSLEQFVHALVMAELKQDIDVVAIFEEMHELSNVGMFHRSMNLDLTHQLLLGPASLQG
jgi:hypothetical protein